MALGAMHTTFHRVRVEDGGYVMYVRDVFENRRFVALRPAALTRGWVLTIAFILVIAPTALAQCETAQLQPLDYSGYDFGYDVALSGDCAFVNATTYLSADDVAVYVFCKDGAN